MPEYARKEVEAAIANIKSRLASQLQSEASVRVANICLSEDGNFIIYSYRDGTTNKIPVHSFMRAVGNTRH